MTTATDTQVLLSSRSFDPDVALTQAGMGNVLAVSGGRVIRERIRATTPEGKVDFLILPVHYGYKVEVSLAADDTYTVRRLYQRGSRTWQKGILTGVYAEELGEAVYRASCFRDAL